MVHGNSILSAIISLGNSPAVTVLSSHPLSGSSYQISKELLGLLTTEVTSGAVVSVVILDVSHIKFVHFLEGNPEKQPHEVSSLPDIGNPSKLEGSLLVHVCKVPQIFPESISDPC